MSVSLFYVNIGSLKKNQCYWIFIKWTNKGFDVDPVSETSITNKLC